MTRILTEGRKAPEVIAVTVMGNVPQVLVENWPQLVDGGLITSVETVTATTMTLTMTSTASAFTGPINDGPGSDRWEQAQRN